MDERLPPQPRVDPELTQQVDRALLEHPGPHARLDVGAVARLEHDGPDPRAGEQEREREAGGPGADDGDLRAHEAEVHTLAAWSTIPGRPRELLNLG